MSKLLMCLWMTCVFTMVSSTTANSTDTSFSNPSTDPTTEISRRLAGLQLPLTAPASDAHLQRKLKDYLGNGSESTERMLGRANQYFPVFEYYLEKHGMPESLKYLAVAESMLVPRAVSGAKAAGLWQLMPATARGMGLRVDNVVDERMDLYRSTEAAVIMLKELHQQFGDWHLALAAYNCGPGRVRRAIRRARGHTYYPKVKRFLPRESQQYVAAYVAAAYTVNYAGEYGLTAADFLTDDGITSLQVYKSLNLRRMAKALELSPIQLRKLNPSFVRGYIPRSREGYRLRVPQEYRWTAQEYIWGRPNLVELPLADELPLAEQFAENTDFSPRMWLLGCNPANLKNQPSVIQREREIAFTLDYYDSFSTVAMLH